MPPTLGTHIIKGRLCARHFEWPKLNTMNDDPKHETPASSRPPSAHSRPPPPHPMPAGFILNPAATAAHPNVPVRAPVAGARRPLRDGFFQPHSRRPTGCFCCALFAVCFFWMVVGPIAAFVVLAATGKIELYVRAWIHG